MTRHPLARRTLAVGAVAALAAGVAAPIASAASSTPAPAPRTAATQRGLFGDLLGGVLGPILGPVLDGTLGDLGTTLDQVVASLPAPLGDAVEGAAGGVLSSGQLTDVLGQLPALDAGQLQAVLATLNPGQLTQLVTGLLSGNGPMAGIGQLIQGLQGLADGAGSAPGADVVNALLTQVRALLAGGLPTGAGDLTQLDGLLGTVTGLLQSLGAGDSLPILGPLLDTLRQVAGDPSAATKLPNLDALIRTASNHAPAVSSLDPAMLLALLSALAAQQTPAHPAPAVKVKAPKAPQSVERARIGTVRVATSRRSARIRLTCAKSAPTTGCRVTVSARLRGTAVLRSKRLTVRRGSSRTVVARVPARTARRVRQVGGRLVIRATTAHSTPRGALKRTVTVHRAHR